MSSTVECLIVREKAVIKKTSIGKKPAAGGPDIVVVQLRTFTAKNEHDQSVDMAGSPR